MSPGGPQPKPRPQLTATALFGETAVARWAPVLAAGVDCGVVIHAPDTTLLFANDKAAEMIGLSRDELTGKVAIDPDFRLLDGQGRPLEVEDYPVVRLAQDPHTPLRDVEIGTLRPGEREPIWGKLSAAAVWSDAGELEAMVVTFVDVTSLRETRCSLARSEERYALAVAGTSDGIWDHEIDRDTTYFAPRFEALLGLSPGALTPTIEAWFALIHPEDRPEVDAAWRDTLDTGTPFDLNFRARHATLGWRQYRASGAASGPDAGRPTRVTGAMRDITEQLRALEVRRAVQEKLHETQRLESLAVLAGGIAHDFNNLLVGVLSSTEAALELVEHPEARASLELCIHSAMRAAELTRQLMAYAGRAQLMLERIDPRRVIEEVSRLVAGNLAGRARLVREPGPDTAPVLVDPTQLRQILLNLVLNGADAVGERGGGTVWVAVAELELGPEDLRRRQNGRSPPRPPGTGPGPSPDRADQADRHPAPGRFVVFTVRDDGVGMSAETLERIFEPFFTTKQHGHGLGLAAVHGMVRSHGGFIEVRSAPGAGTTVDVAFPAAVGPGDPVKTPEARRAPEPDPDRAGPTLALIVDDEAAVRQVLRAILERDGFVVRELATGTRVLEALAAEPIDVVFLDVSLPGTSGTAIEAQIRAERPTLPVVLMSGHVDAADRVELTGDRPTVFLPKPFRLHEVRRRLADLL